ncbi:elongation factor 1-alpha C-terminal domain-related protein, partial [Streptacidiphilus anmyonensis]|uniref:elongation factor 1-alpha C-terminal domain-related protein n=1 Tax=Streptacidiphilus anmyonensis TaxID=405782 RepID=UPI0005A7F5FE
VLAVNKMDLVDYAEPVFAAIAEEFTGYATGLGVPEVTAVPISALGGDNVVEPSARMDWYGGPTVLEHLESVHVGDEAASPCVRFPVQMVIRHGGERYYAGQLLTGRLRVGQTVTVQPCDRTTTVTALDVLGQSADVVAAGASLSVRLADEIDIGRGDMLTAGPPPRITKEVQATVCHVADTPLTVGQRVLLKHTTRTVKAIVEDIPSRLTLDDLSQDPHPGRLTANDIGRVTLRTAEPLALDSYADSRRTGSFLLIDPADGTTLVAGMAGDSFAARSPSPAVAAARTEADGDGWDF